MAGAWREGAAGVVAAAVGPLVAVVRWLVVAAACVAVLLPVFWIVVHVGLWLAENHPAVLVFLVFVALLLGGGSRGDGVADRLGDIHTTLLMRR